MQSRPNTEDEWKKKKSLLTLLWSQHFNKVLRETLEVLPPSTALGSRHFSVCPVCAAATGISKIFDCKGTRKAALLDSASPVCPCIWQLNFQSARGKKHLFHSTTEQHTRKWQSEWSNLSRGAHLSLAFACWEMGCQSAWLKLCSRRSFWASYP